MFTRNRELIDEIAALSADEREYLYAALTLHGHACGGMPMGFVGGLAALRALGIERERNMDTVAIVHAGRGHAAGCFVDGVQFATGCTFGKGVMQRAPKGKWSFELIHKPSGRAVRVRIRNAILDRAFAAPFITDYRKKGVRPTDIPAQVAHPGFKRLFGLDAEEVVKIEGPYERHLPKPKPCFERVVCSVCGASVAENYARREEGAAVCVDCTHYAS